MDDFVQPQVRHDIGSTLDKASQPTGSESDKRANSHAWQEEILEMVCQMKAQEISMLHDERQNYRWWAPNLTAIFEKTRNMIYEQRLSKPWLSTAIIIASRRRNRECGESNPPSFGDMAPVQTANRSNYEYEVMDDCCLTMFKGRLYTLCVWLRKSIFLEINLKISTSLHSE
jgi:hypothetical protein